MKRLADTATRMYWVITVLGLTPFDPRIPPRLKYVPIVYSVVLIAWYFAQIVWCFSVIYRSPTLSVLTVAIVFQKFCQSLVPVLVITEGLFDKGVFMKRLFDDAILSDHCLAMIGLEMDYSEMKSFIDKTCLYVTVYTLSFICSMMVVLMKLAKISISEALSLTLLHLSHVVYNNYLTFYFCVLIGCFQYRFKFVNDQIKYMLRGRFEDEKSAIIMVKPYGVDDITKIQTFKIIHAIYRSIMAYHNKRISVVMILQILQSMITVILFAYFWICMLLDLLDLHDLGKFMVILFLLNVIQCFGMVICTAVVCCSRTSSEGNYTEYLVHRLMSETEDTEVLKELEDFSLEMVHDKVEFMSCEYFTLDYTLFTKIIGAVISYVIIFLQFGKFDFQELINFARNESTKQNYL